MLARLMDQETILVEIEIRDKPPKFLRGDGKSFWHCGTTRENIAIYRVQSFGAGLTCRESMPLKPRNYWGRKLERIDPSSANLIPFAGRER